MSYRKHSRQKGQALLLTTISLAGIFGMVGLAVDVGYGRYVQRVTQASADAAALAAASAALDAMGQTAAASCTSGVSCGSLAPCPSTGSLQSGCLYAQQDAFEQ